MLAIASQERYAWTEAAAVRVTLLVAGQKSRLW
jgi:hypothetical protein